MTKRTGLRSAVRPSGAASPRDRIGGHHAPERRQTTPPHLSPSPSQPHDLPEVTT